MTPEDVVAFLQHHEDPVHLVETTKIALPWDSEWDYEDARLAQAGWRLL